MDHVESLRPTARYRAAPMYEDAQGVGMQGRLIETVDRTEVVRCFEMLPAREVV